MRLNLPVQGTVDRRREPYKPYLVKIGLYEPEEEERRRERLQPFPMRVGAHEPEEEEKKLGDLMGEPDGNFGHDPGDPSPLECRETRGWCCQPVWGCACRGVL
jgi:hypothetical protein